MSNENSRSWFCVFNNPADHGYTGGPEEVLLKLRSEWISLKASHVGAWSYCVSESGMHHVHMVLEDSGSTMRFSEIKTNYCVGMHIEATKGDKKQVEDYINKSGKFAESGEDVLLTLYHGEVKGRQGMRTDFDNISTMIQDGYTPFQIMDSKFAYRRYEKMIKDAYFSKRKKETPLLRDINVHWIFGESGTGKTFSLLDLAEKHGEGSIYLMSDYERGGFDFYCGEPILFMDEFKGQLPFNKLLLMLQGYKTQLPSRYTNSFALWNEVYITSVFAPDEVYTKMVKDSSNIDSYSQLKRRISDITYCYKMDDVYGKVTIPMSLFDCRSDVIRRVPKVVQPSWLQD